MSNLDWWYLSAAIKGAHTTWAPGQLVAEGPFSNPARMVEDQGLGAQQGGPTGSAESVWAHAGWWDKEYAR